MRIVLDTNVLVSGFMFGTGPSGQLLDAWRLGEFDLLTSDYQLEELTRVFQYPRLRKRIDSAQTSGFVDELMRRATMVSNLPEVSIAPDPDDNPILATAIAGFADLIVSGDEDHVLSLGEVHDTPVVTPRDALSRLSNP